MPLSTKCAAALLSLRYPSYYNLFYLFTCFTKFNLKSDNDLQFTKSAGSEFHSVIDLGKKENLKTSLDTSGTLYLKAWLLRVLFSLFGISVLLWICLLGYD